MSEHASVLRVSHSVLARNRAESFGWLATQGPGRRTLTREECHILAREADGFAAEFSRLAARTEDAEALVEALGKIAHVPVEEKGDYEALTRYMRRVAHAALARITEGSDE